MSTTLFSPSSWTPDHQGYKERPLHKPTCEGNTPSTCNCGCSELWVLNEDVIDLVSGKTGKWMFFPVFSSKKTDEYENSLDTLWAMAAEHTREGFAGWGLKLSLKNMDKPALMFYTKNYEDEEDRERVKASVYSLLADFGIPTSKRSLRYKTDEATAQGLYSARDVDKRGHQQGVSVSRFHDVREVCKFFNTPRGCRHGDECHFRHE